ncbi:MAG: acyl-protein synthetase [Spirochaetia bacterium]|nr:acyl-protein synthetase [Spirochaetia bacterium]
MYDIADIQNIPPFSLDRGQKEEFLSEILWDLTQHHYAKCPEYRRILDAWPFDMEGQISYKDLPFLPVRLFKEYELRSMEEHDVVKQMTSSGTTGQQVSRIFLDKETATNQTKILTKIVSDFIGTKRLPMIILDTRAILKDRNLFSARGAGILGYSIFGSDKIYALDEEMRIDFEALEAFLEKHEGEDIFLFGFTFMIWQHFYKELAKSGRMLDLSQGILIHGGGWKKLIDEAVDNATFKEKLKVSAQTANQALAQKIAEAQSNLHAQMVASGLSAMHVQASISSSHGTGQDVGFRYSYSEGMDENHSESIEYSEKK